MVIIAGPNGTYHYGSASQCPYGCAVNGRCGSETECRVGGIVGIIFGILFCLCCCGCCINSCRRSGIQAAEEAYSSRSSNKSTKKVDILEPLVVGAPVPAAPMGMPMQYNIAKYAPSGESWIFQ